MATKPLDALTAGVEAYLAALPEKEFTDLVARVRDPEDQLDRDAARNFFGGNK